MIHNENDSEMQLIAIKNNEIEISKETSEYIRQSVSENSRRAFNADIEHFISWGGKVESSPALVAAYLTAHADILSIATLRRRLASISKAHRMKGHLSPTQSEVVKMTFRGIQRVCGVPQRQASPLLKEDVISIYGQTHDTTKGIRDMALLLIGFCGAFRRSELIGLQVEDVEFTSQGAAITLTRSKTDQIGAGRKVAIPYGRGRICPVSCLSIWLETLDADTGPIFRPINKGGRIANSAISGKAVSEIIKHYVEKIDLDPKRYSGHSLRAGLATSAAQHGASSMTIRKTTGHKSDSMLSQYIRDGDMFTDNASGLLF